MAKQRRKAKAKPPKGATRPMFGSAEGAQRHLMTTYVRHGEKGRPAPSPKTKTGQKAPAPAPVKRPGTPKARPRTIEATALLADPTEGTGGFARLASIPEENPLRIHVEKGAVKTSDDADQLIRLLKSRLANTVFATEDEAANRLLSHARRVSGVHMMEEILNREGDR